MSGPRSGTSSAAAQGREEPLVSGDDSLDRRWFGSEVPLVQFERAAKNDPIGPREHVSGPTGQGVAHFWLRLENSELAARWVKVLIGKKITTAKAGAVEHE